MGPTLEELTSSERLCGGAERFRETASLAGRGRHHEWVSGDIRPDLARVFDDIGERYSEAFADKPGQMAMTAWIIDRLAGLDHRPIVLDVGCGTGVPTARQLVEAGFEVVGIDTSPVMLDIARRNVPDAILVERDLTDLDGLHPVGARFDAATAFFSLLVLPRSQLGVVLDTIHRVLRPGAPFAVGMVEGDTDFMLRDFLGTQVPLTAYPRDELAVVLADHGFEVLVLTAETWRGATPDAPEQTHLYARCLCR